MSHDYEIYETDDYVNLLKYCPNCGGHYDDIDYDYQICSVCGHDGAPPTVCINPKVLFALRRMKKVTKGRHWLYNDLDTIHCYVHEKRETWFKWKTTIKPNYLPF